MLLGQVGGGGGDIDGSNDEEEASPDTTQSGASQIESGGQTFDTSVLCWANEPTQITVESVPDDPTAEYLWESSVAGTTFDGNPGPYTGGPSVEVVVPETSLVTISVENLNDPSGVCSLDITAQCEVEPDQCQSVTITQPTEISSTSLETEMQVCIESLLGDGSNNSSDFIFSATGIQGDALELSGNFEEIIGNDSGNSLTTNEVCVNYSGANPDHGLNIHVSDANDNTCTDQILYRPPYCGDGNIDVDEGEQCDDGNTDNGDGCDSECNPEQEIECGNGVVEAGEECDDGNTDNGDGCTNVCTRPGGGGGGGGGGGRRCGNGRLDRLEVCDYGIRNPDANGYHPECSRRCTIPETACGNGILEPGEICDDGNRNDNDDCTNRCVGNAEFDLKTFTFNFGVAGGLQDRTLEILDSGIYQSELRVAHDQDYVLHVIEFKGNGESNVRVALDQDNNGYLPVKSKQIDPSKSAKVVNLQIDGQPFSIPAIESGGELRRWTVGSNDPNTVKRHVNDNRRQYIVFKDSGEQVPECGSSSYDACYSGDITTNRGIEFENLRFNTPLIEIKFVDRIDSSLDCSATVGECDTEFFPTTARSSINQADSDTVNVVCPFPVIVGGDVFFEEGLGTGTDLSCIYGSDFRNTDGLAFIQTLDEFTAESCDPNNPNRNFVSNFSSYVCETIVGTNSALNYALLSSQFDLTEFYSTRYSDNTLDPGNTGDSIVLDSLEISYLDGLGLRPNLSSKIYKSNGKDLIIGNPNAPLVPEEDFLDSNGSDLYRQARNSIPKINIGEGARTIIVENADLYINADTTYADFFGTDTKKIPSIAFIVKNGNIYIHPQAREFAGIMYVQEGRTGTGRITQLEASSAVWDQYRIDGSVYGDIGPLYNLRGYAAPVTTTGQGANVFINYRLPINIPPGLSNLPGFSQLIEPR